jgi:hypothetical protein
MRSARDALAFVDSLQRSDEEIKFIKAPGEGEVGIAMLRVLADEEGLPKRPRGPQEKRSNHFRSRSCPIPKRVYLHGAK